MENIDARTLSPQTQFELRKHVIRLRKKGVTNKAAAEIVGISETYASTLWQSYQRGGIEAIKPKVRGRRYERNEDSRPNRRRPFRSFWWTRHRIN